ncbi:MAG: hypothetical protein K0S65_1936 [Labilithrix sp.]|nr:hypothetical protein [Labilithrix sp.]
MPSAYEPYKPPHHDAYGLPTEYGPYQPLGWKTTGSAVGMIATILLGLLTAIVPMGAEQTLTMFAVVGLLGLVSMGVSIFTSIVFLLWTYQAAKNVRAFGQRGLTFTPGWAVGWWFVPVASLWLPYKALREIWRASDPDALGSGGGAWMTRSVPSLFPLWWTTYLLYSFVSAFSVIGQIMTGLQQPGKAEVGGGMGVIAGSFFLVIAAVAIISIMKQLDRRQEVCARLHRDQDDAHMRSLPAGA